MISSYRKYFNQHFTAERYTRFLEMLTGAYPPLSAKLSETPVFIPAALRDQLIAAGEEIIKVIRQPDFKTLTANAVPREWNVPDENSHPHFLAFDFAVCKNEEGALVPKLIELQGFPSLFAFQAQLANCYQKAFELGKAGSFSPYFHGMNEQQYFDLLKEVIIGTHIPEEVALVDTDAPNQKTAIDFWMTAEKLGLRVLSLSDIFKEGRQLFYLQDGRKIRLKRIYNRLIYDDIKDTQDLLSSGFDPREPADVEWITHPNWFYRISKYTMPFLKNEFVPETHFLDMLQAIPEDLENYVLKPLFSFAGRGVVINISGSDIENLPDPQNWILQKKVDYEPVVSSPDGMLKAEIRLLYVWPDGGEPRLCVNLVRLSRGEMMGVRYNAGDTWAGSTVGLMD